MLPGYTVFDVSDARLAAERLLQRAGKVRLKRTLCSGGTGQVVIGSAVELEQFVEELAQEELAIHGLVLEEDLRDAKTLSIGRTKLSIGRTNLNSFVLSYYGKQRRTRDNDGGLAYGGSRTPLPMSEPRR